MKVLHFHNTGKLVRHWVASNFGLITFRGICDTKYKLLSPIPNILMHRWLFCLLFLYSIHIAVVLRKGQADLKFSSTISASQGLGLETAARLFLGRCEHMSIYLNRVLRTEMISPSLIQWASRFIELPQVHTKQWTSRLTELPSRSMNDPKKTTTSPKTHSGRVTTHKLSRIKFKSLEHP